MDIKAIFRKKKSAKKLVAFSTDPKTSGLVDVAFGVPITLLFVLRCHELDCWLTFGTIVSFLLLGYILVNGTYRLLFRKGAVQDNVTLGSLHHKLYQRFGRWFIPVGFVLYIAAFTALVAVLSLLFVDEGMTVQGSVSHVCLSLSWLLIGLMYKVVRSYVDFRHYYSSPKDSRKEIDWY